MLALQGAAGNRAVSRLLSRKPYPDHPFPWIGSVKPWSAALRAAPSGPREPKAKVLADLPRGAEVRVVSRKGGWLHVEADVGGTTLTGYVSHELIAFERQSAFDVGEITIRVRVPSLAEALVALKRTERRRLAEGPAFSLSEDERDAVDLAISVVERTGRYVVDPTTFGVDFKAPKATVTAIEDFILFVEAVERAYPNATPGQVASEIRQAWYADANWLLLSAGRGIPKVDIESAGPVFDRFDMKQVAPATGSLELDTRMGRVDIGHVMAGIDVALNGFSSEPSMTDFTDLVKWRTMNRASGGDTRDFATWSGDLGQAYAEYILDHVDRGKTSSTLDAWMKEKAPAAELLGDIHGYIARAVWASVPASASPTGTEFRVSNFLRDLYLVPKPGATARSFVESVSKRMDLKAFILERSLAFASIWYAKAHAPSTAEFIFGSPPTPRELVARFYEHHAANEASAARTDRLEAKVDDLLRMMEGRIR